MMSFPLLKNLQWHPNALGMRYELLRVSFASHKVIRKSMFPCLVSHSLWHKPKATNWTYSNLLKCLSVSQLHEITSRAYENGRSLMSLPPFLKPVGMEPAILTSNWGEPEKVLLLLVLILELLLPLQVCPALPVRLLGLSSDSPLSISSWLPL